MQHKSLIKKSLTLFEVICALVLMGLITSFVAFNASDVYKHHREKEALSQLCQLLQTGVESSRITGEQMAFHLTNQDQCLLLTSTHTPLTQSIKFLSIEPSSLFITLTPESSEISNNQFKISTLRNQHYRVTLQFTHYPHVNLDLID